MIEMIVITSIVINIVQFLVMKSIMTESKPKGKTVYKDKIVYKDKVVEKIVYKDKIVEKIVYVDRPVKTTEHSFVRKEEVTVSKEKLELMNELAILKAKKNKNKKDNENIYTLEKVIPNLK